MMSSGLGNEVVPSVFNGQSVLWPPLRTQGQVVMFRIAADVYFLFFQRVISEAR